MHGLAASEAGAYLSLRLRLASGYLHVAYERSWRSAGSARVRCESPCHCRPLELNLTDADPGRRLTRNVISPSTWVQTPAGPHAKPALSNSMAAGTTLLCPVLIELLQFTSGRLMVSAVTVSARTELFDRRQDSSVRNIGEALDQVLSVGG